MNVQLFIPCFVDQLYPQTAFNMVRVLEKLGCKVEYNTLQTCCGQPAFNAGFQDECKEVAFKFIKDFSGADFIITPSASCAGFDRCTWCIGNAAWPRCGIAQRVAIADDYAKRERLCWVDNFFVRINGWRWGAGR